MKVDPLRQPVTFRSVVRRRRGSTTLSKAKFAPKEGYGDCLVVRSRVCPTLVNRKGPILLHDNARPHLALPTLQKLNEPSYETLPHPPYSPELSSTDYHFFKHLDNFLREKCFKTQDDAKNAFSDFIATRSPDFYATGINKLVSRWQECVNCDGSYFD
ncbi:unnamed protein product, partial [Mesorhabditis belari]|uniref:Histone-lysine N-methyltransferase SETMAR n=1 Tax=Mesorhabditis belari TaxID=2138241 RepID=A0AAF3EF69_9BILA